MRTKRQWLFAVGVGLLLLGGLLLIPGWVAAWPVSRVVVWQFAKHDVAVEVAWVTTATGARQLVGTFTPLRAGFHLYSKDLPPDGLNGAGRPTWLEVAPAAGVQGAGPLTVDQTAQVMDFAELPLFLPVYPPGPVTLHLPLALTNTAPTVVEISVTYMACSENACLPPVTDARQWVTLPPGP